MIKLSNNARAALILSIGAVTIAVATTLIVSNRKDRGQLPPKPGCDTMAWGDGASPFFLGRVPGAGAEWSESIDAGISIWSAYDSGLIMDVGESPDLASGSAGIITIEVMPEAIIPRVCEEVEEGNGCVKLEWKSTARDPRACKITKAEIFVPVETPPSKRACAVAHELGHAVFLFAHDDSEESIMYISNRLSGCKVTPHDADLVRGMYHQAAATK